MGQSNSIQVPCEAIVEIAEILIDDLLAYKRVLVGQELEQKVLMLLHASQLVQRVVAHSLQSLILHVSDLIRIGIYLDFTGGQVPAQVVQAVFVVESLFKIIIKNSGYRAQLTQIVQFVGMLLPLGIIGQQLQSQFL